MNSFQPEKLMKKLVQAANVINEKHDYKLFISKAKKKLHKNYSLRNIIKYVEPKKMKL